MRKDSPLIKQCLGTPILGATHPGSSASSSCERAALTLISSSSVSATSSRLLVLDLACGSYYIVGGRGRKEPEDLWGHRRATWPRLHSTPDSPSLQPHSKSGPHLSGFVNATELLSHRHGDRGGAWKWVLGLGQGGGNSLTGSG